MRTWAYIDGFNLYHRAAKPTGHKWLDLSALCQHLLPRDTITHTKYFTALVRTKAGDRHQLQKKRQLTYWDALWTLANFEIVEGYFQPRYVPRPLADSVRLINVQANARQLSPKKAKPAMVEIFDIEEKGSDVNLGVHLVHDAHRGMFEQALVISNDADLREALRIVRDDLGLRVGLSSPTVGLPPNPKLQNVASFYVVMNMSHLRATLLPDPVIAPDGTVIAKPVEW